MLFCSRYIYLRETFVLGMLPGPLPTWRPRWEDPGGSSLSSATFFGGTSQAFVPYVPWLKGFGMKKKQEKKQSGGGSLWRPKWSPQADFEPSKLEKSFWMIMYECYPLTIGKVFLPFKSSLWRIKKYILFSMCGSHEGYIPKNTVDGSEIPNNHLRCMKLCK